MFSGVLQKAILCLSSVCATIVLLEVALTVWQGLGDSGSGPSSSPVDLMPSEWTQRFVRVRGAKKAYYWHGHLQVFDRNEMRRSTPFPDRRQGVGRVAVVGDSMTYGQGVDATNAYPSVLERLLQSNGYDMEVLNLGVPGWQSENVLEIVREWVPQLHPDLVIYGICLNDFLEAGQREYKSNMRYPFPLPASWKIYLAQHTHVGRAFGSGYNNFLMKAGLRQDFYADILSNINDRQARFEKDLKQMNDFVRSLGLVPICSITIDQAPVSDGRGQRIALIAESAAAKAGMEVVSSSEYYDKYSGHDFRVSQWELHPNEEAHAIFADMLYRRIIQSPALAPYKKREP